MHKRREKERPLGSRARGTPRYRESAIANINKYPGSTIECTAAHDRVREPFHRRRSCERKAKARSGETKSRVTTQSPAGPRFASDRAAEPRRAYRGRAAESRGIPRASERWMIRLCPSPPTFVYPPEAPLSRRPPIHGRGPRERKLPRSREGGNSQSEFPLDSLFRAAVSAPPNKVEAAGRERAPRPSRAEGARRKPGGCLARADRSRSLDSGAAMRLATRANVGREGSHARARKLTELCGELDTLGERCTVTNAMAMRHRRRAVPASRRGRNTRSTLLSRAHVRSRRQERGKPVIFRAPSTASRSRRPCSIQSTVAHRARSRPRDPLPPSTDARESALIARAARANARPRGSWHARRDLAATPDFSGPSLPPINARCDLTAASITRVGSRLETSKRIYYYQIQGCIAKLYLHGHSTYRLISFYVDDTSDINYYKLVDWTDLLFFCMLKIAKRNSSDQNKIANNWTKYKFPTFLTKYEVSFGNKYSLFTWHT